MNFKIVLELLGHPLWPGPHPKNLSFIRFIDFLKIAHVTEHYVRYRIHYSLFRLR